MERTDAPLAYGREAIEFFSEGFDSIDMGLGPLFYLMPMDRADVRIAGLSGTTTMNPRTGPRDPFEELPLKEGYDRTATVVGFLAGFTFGEADWADMPEDLRAHAARELGASGPRTVDKACASWLAALTTTSLGADDLSIGNANHTLKHAGGAVDSNIGAGGYSDANFALARAMLLSTLDDHGQLRPEQPYGLIYGPGNWRTVRQVLTADLIDANMTPNVAKGQLVPFENPWTTDTDDWAIMPRPRPGGPCIVGMRKAPDFVWGYDAQTRVTYMNASMRFVVFGVSWRGSVVYHT